MGRPRLRVVLPPCLPEGLAIEISARLRLAAATAGANVTWIDTPLDAEFSLIAQRRADAGLGWLSSASDVRPDPLEVMRLGEFEPEVWIPSSIASGYHGIISLDELACLRVIHGPRRARAATYDAWLTVLRTSQPGFEFTDPPFRHSLPMTLAFAATAGGPAAVLTGPLHAIRAHPAPIRSHPAAADRCDMIRVGIEGRPLTATAALTWRADLPCELQQILFDTADRITYDERQVAAS